MSSLKKKIPLKYYLNEIKVVASRSRAQNKHPLSMTSLLLQGYFPNHSLFSQHIQTFSLLLLFIFFGVVFSRNSRCHVFSSRCSVPSAQSHTTAEISMKVLAKKEHFKHPVAVTSLSSKPLLDLPPPPPAGNPSSFTSPCNSWLCPFSSLWPLWKVLACQACVKSSLWPSEICFFSRFCLFCSHTPGWRRGKCL